ncbi:MAG: hypothetical protein P1U58_16815 [Verrucomicrobiales bacterium]|nr:hypothetical protein [Verrucomicrobiales bacterium]
MKNFLLILLTSVGFVFSLEAQEPVIPGQPGAMPMAAAYVPSREIEMTPDQKRPLILKSEERNPYARRSPDKQELNDQGDNAEELEIRERLSSLSVSGRSQGNNGLRVLLGDIIIEQGRILPKLLQDQSEDLKVMEVSDDSVILGWLDIETGELTGKTMQMAYDLTPSISYALHGQDRAPSSDGGVQMAERRMGVLHIGQERKKQKSQMAANDPAKRLPREVTEAGQ